MRPPLFTFTSQFFNSTTPTAIVNSVSTINTVSRFTSINPSCAVMAATASTPTHHVKQYVFVDEYNRHKHLKVTRACDGCRKRKIKCDGALQNGPWPCGACTRLKLKCVPPTLDADDEQDPPNGACASTGQVFSHSALAGSSAARSSISSGVTWHDWSTDASSPTADANTASTMIQPNLGAHIYGPDFFSQPSTVRLDSGYGETDSLTSHVGPDSYRQLLSRQDIPAPEAMEGNSPGADAEEIEATVEDLSRQLGELSVDYTAQAPWIKNQNKAQGETPMLEDDNSLLPSSVHADPSVCIPVEMMPSEARALDYFGYFFEYIHPYVPVLNQTAFYEQWHHNRSAISPLILDGIFACVAQYLDEPLVVRKWLALASRHEDRVKDLPRISTIQALIILLKAQEFHPRRGYYYRSWMAVKYMAAMAIDLNLHEHHGNHQIGVGCNFSRTDCLLHNRIWQTLFSLEIFVGAPQGRTDYAIDLETVDFSVPSRRSDVDETEYQISRRTAYFALCVRTNKQSSTIWNQIRRYNKEWALDPMFVRQNDVIPALFRTLPSDMQIHFPEDEKPPYLGGDHYVAYLHCYHHIVVIIHHRAQFQTLLWKKDPAFNKHLTICNDAASKICRLQEALLRDYGLHGLKFMQRGIGFSIYAVLICLVLQLVRPCPKLSVKRIIAHSLIQVTITSPYPATNARARSYFIRHMRVLESCSTSTTPEMKVQIEALREAFSADTSRSFELKPDLGIRSPSTSHGAPGNLSRHSDSRSASGVSPWSARMPPTPLSKNDVTTTAAADFDPTRQAHTPTSFDSSGYFMPNPTTFPASDTLYPIASAPAAGYALDGHLGTNGPGGAGTVWDPSTIFEQWDTAFGLPSQPSPPQAPSIDTAVLTSVGVAQPASPTTPQPQPQPQPLMVSGLPAVTPVMWQHAFANAYVTGHGTKRTRDDGGRSCGSWPKRRASGQ